LSLWAWLLLSSSTFGQASPNSVNPTEHSSDRHHEIKLTGCLVKGSDQVPLGLATEDGFFILTGQTSGLEQYNGREVSLQGKKGPDISIDGFYSPFSSFVVTKLVEIIPKRQAKLDASFTNRASWRVETLEKYGVKFAHPENMSVTTEPDPNLPPNFVVEEASETATIFGIPGAAYPYTDFLGGTFTIFVNRHITHGGSCLQFGQSVESSSFRQGKLQYSESRDFSGGMGTYYHYFYFHIFQYETCYELAFELVTHDPSMGGIDAACNIPLLSEDDQWNLVKPLLESVTFVPPGVPPAAQEKRQLQPRITEFSVSSDTADAGNSGFLIF